MRKILATAAVAIATSIAGIAASTSASAQNFVWETNAYNDPGNKGRYTAYLTLGVPETDNQHFHATCSPGSSAMFAPTVFSYNTADLKPGKRVNVKFYQNGRQVYQKPGEVYRGESEEGVSGILFRPGVNDYLWTVLSRGTYIRYEIGSMGKAGMHLNGSTRAIGKFRRNCGAILNASNSGGAVDDSDNEENNVSSARSCNKYRNVKSRNSQIPVTVRFVNKSGAHRSVMWIDYKGQPKHYKDLNPGESYSQKTYAGHPWMFTDGPGNCKEMFMPKRSSKRFNITYSR